jgi:hypothetical protein
MTAPRLPFVNVPPKRPSLDDIFNERPSLDDVFNDRPTVKAAASDMTQTKATTKNVTGRPNDWAGAARTVGQGLTGGFGDEMEAGARRLLTGEPYDQSVQRILDVVR